VEKAGVQFQVGFNRRFDPTFLAMKKGIVEGCVGKPQILKITSRDPYPPTKEFLLASGGMFMVTTIHDFDMARYLINSEVKRISAVGRVLIEPYIRDVGTVDTAVVTLEFENGALGIIDNSWKAVYGYDQRVEVFGSKGKVMSENQTPHRMVYANTQAIQAPLPVHFFMERYVESYVNEMNAFVTAIREDSESPVTVRDARISLLMALAAEKSCAEERSVTLTEVDTGLLQFQA
jgi:myo-inositol 2-dehydrogenase/D-chiro-inositol 1-dehydrogenase